MIDKVLVDLKSLLPTRVVLIIPVFRGGDVTRWRNKMELGGGIRVLRVPEHKFQFSTPDSYRNRESQVGAFRFPVEVWVLFNQASACNEGC